ncbi:KEOPS complex subunit Pcc1 [Halorussus sp. MSC15.2]|uniref:KEOPS complex subunit Pcc1 n=1 Tax=Halorussus sp. MSC15.2 TaxID=2283638 RepID=UPI0013D30215|nr:KEOPS complex subunit Pcc1 [Halorussus sp. MSC15.2]NEU56767.1 KEOPS complex Pcc1-like subunit [Halorussus sp. MSC15.2]
MTGRQSDADGSAGRSATIRTELDDAAILAASVRPDNTPEIDTRAADGVIETSIERETTGGLRTTVDDYVVNLAVAQEVAQAARRHANGSQTDASESRANADDTTQS